jgi:hypothetical protein
MDNPNITWGKWQEWMRKLDSESDWKSKLLGEWPAVNDAVYSREQVDTMLKRGEISEKRADELLRMRYELNRKGEKVVCDVERY